MRIVACEFPNAKRMSHFALRAIGSDALEKNIDAILLGLSENHEWTDIKRQMASYDRMNAQIHPQRNRAAVIAKLFEDAEMEEELAWCDSFAALDDYRERRNESNRDRYKEKMYRFLETEFKKADVWFLIDKMFGDGFSATNESIISEIGLISPHTACCLHWSGGMLGLVDEIANYDMVMQMLVELESFQ